MTPAVFNQYITTTLTQTIPNEITQAVVNGANGATGATGFDSLMNAITHSAAAARAQMPFPFYISERVGLWMAELACKIFIAFSFIVWALSALTVYFLVPLLAFLAPTFLFNATRSYGERWAGKIVALILAQTIALMVAAVVISQEGSGFSKWRRTSLRRRTPTPAFSMNAGDLNFGEFALGAPNPVAPGAERHDQHRLCGRDDAGDVRIAHRRLHVARCHDNHCLRDRRRRWVEFRPGGQPDDRDHHGARQGCRWRGNRRCGPGSWRTEVAMRFYSAQVRILPRLIWGIGALVLAHYEFKPPAPDWIGGIILTLIALWCFLTAARLVWNIGRISLWP